MSRRLLRRRVPDVPGVYDDAAPAAQEGAAPGGFGVTVANKANAPVLVALEGEDPDGELLFGSNRPPQQISAGREVQSTMRVRPPKQIWTGRPQDRRLEVKTITGGEAAERAAADPLAAEVLDQTHGWRRRGLSPARVPPPGSTRPTPRSARAASRCGCRNSRRPQVKSPQLKPMQVKALTNLKLPGRGGGSPAPAAALLPTQGTFCQKS